MRDPRKALGAAAVALALAVVALWLARIDPVGPRSPDPAGMSPHTSTLSTAPDGFSAAALRQEAESANAGLPSALSDAILKVIGASGVAVPNTPMVLFDGLAVVQQLRTDEDGVAVVDASGATLEWYARSNNGRPIQRSVTLTAGEHELRAPQGDVVAGRVLVDGAPPQESIEVDLGSAVQFWPDLRDLPEPVRAALFGNAAPTIHDLVLTDARGCFRFAGLPHDFQGYVHADSWGFERDDPAAHPILGWTVSRPREDLVLRVRRLPRIRGRVVDAGGSPQADVSIQAELCWDDGTSAGSNSWTEPDGTFDVPVEQPPPEEVRLAFSGDQAGGWKRLVLTSGLDRDVALGDVRLEAPAPVQFRVVDASGSPVAGARGASREDRCNHRGEPTGSDGRGSFVPRPDQASFCVLASGFDVADVPWTGANGEFQVVLTRATRLVVAVVDAAGTPIQGARVQLSTEGTLTTDPPGVILPVVDAAAESTPSSWSWTETGKASPPRPSSRPPMDAWWSGGYGPTCRST